jgi:hypothetical protein
LREACGDELPKLSGIVEIDETYIGGKEGNKRERKKLKAGRSILEAACRRVSTERRSPVVTHFALT